MFSVRTGSIKPVVCTLFACLCSDDEFVPYAIPEEIDTKGPNYLRQCIQGTVCVHLWVSTADCLVVSVML